MYIALLTLTSVMVSQTEWTPRVSGGAAELAADPVTRHVSSSSLRISALHAREAAWASALPAAVESQRAYRLSAWIRTDGLREAEAQVLVEWLDASGNVVSSAATESAIGTYDWLPYRALLTSPPNARSARLVCRLRSTFHDPSSPSYASGTAWFDGVALERVPAVSIASQQPGNLFFVGKPVELQVALSQPTALAPTALSYQVRDFGGRVVCDGKVPWDPTTAPSSSARLTLPVVHRGYYELRWSLPLQNGRDALKGSVSLAVVADPRHRRYYPDSPLALDAGFSWFYTTPERLQTAAKVARAAGLSCLRDRLSWGATEPERGRFDWGWYRKAADAQRGVGITVYQVFHDSPSWATSAPPNTRDRHSYPPTNPDDAYRYFRKAAAEFKDSTKFWEIWNEPDIFFFAGRPEEYAAVLKAAYLGCKEGNPNCEVLLGSLAMQAGPWMERVFENGACDYFDLFNMHYYGPVDGVLERIAANKALLEQFHCHKPIWLTEMGVPARRAPDGTFTQSERDQAVYLVKAYANALSHGVDRFFFFYMAEFLEYASSLWGIVRSDLTPKPAYAALAAMTETLGEARFVGQLDLGDPDARGYLFRNGGRYVMVAWSNAPKGVSLPASRALTLTDIMGVASQRPSRRGQVAVDLSPVPVYVSGLPAAIAKQAHDPAPWPKRRPRPAPATADPVWISLAFVQDRPKPDVDQVLAERNAFVARGESQLVAVDLHNYSRQPATVQVTLSAPAGWRLVGDSATKVSAAAGQTARTTFTLRRDSPQPGGEGRVAATATAPGHRISPAVGYIKAG